MQKNPDYNQSYRLKFDIGGDAWIARDRPYSGYGRLTTTDVCTTVNQLVKLEILTDAQIN